MSSIQKQDIQQAVKRAKVIALSNLSGSDALPLLDGILNQLPRKSSVLVVETPCTGTPRMVYSQIKQKDQISKISKEQSIDQFLLDYDRKSVKHLSSYTFKVDEIEYLTIYSKSIPENPVIRKLSSNQPLIELPFFLIEEYGSMYDYIIFMTQATISHAATHFAMRAADVIVLYSNTAIDFVGNFTSYDRLIRNFGIPKERLFLYSADNHINLNDYKIYKKPADIMKAINAQTELPKTSVFDMASQPNMTSLHSGNETPGLIDPLQYLNYQYVQTDEQKEISSTDQERLQSLIDRVRQDLSRDHLEEFVGSLRSEEARQKIRYIIADMIHDMTHYEFTLSRDQVIRLVQREITELGPMQDLLDDEEISSIEINAPNQVIVDRNGVNMYEAKIDFKTVDNYIQFINKMLAPIGKPFTGSEPIVDANYGGFRINVIADDETREGVSARFPMVSIRKFRKDIYTDEECIAYGNMSAEISDFLRFVIRAGVNVVISGSTDSGKTSTMARFPSYLDPITRVISIEDTPELRFAAKPYYIERGYVNLPSLIVKKSDDPRREIGIDLLIRACLRQRPDVNAIGEIRAKKEAKEALVAMNTGHTTWLSLHSESAADAMVRLLILNDNTSAAAAQIAGSIHLLIHQQRLLNGKRVITQIEEAVRYEGTEKAITNPIFYYDFDREKHIRCGNIETEKFLNKIKSKQMNPQDIYYDFDKVGALI